VIDAIFKAIFILWFIMWFFLKVTASEIDGISKILREPIIIAG